MLFKTGYPNLFHGKVAQNILIIYIQLGRSLSQLLDYMLTT